MLDAGQVFSFDVDSDALEICQSNVDDFDVTSTVDLISCDLIQSSQMLDYLTKRRFVDTVVMNPPFGTKNNKGMLIA